MYLIFILGIWYGFKISLFVNIVIVEIFYILVELYFV